MTDLPVTIAVVPRERFSAVQQSLEALLERTPTPRRLVYVDGGSPGPVRRYLERAAKAHGFLLLRSERYLSPNEARNLALPHVQTPYVAFVDNDIIPAAGWLEQLVECARETGAWVVGPLYYETVADETRIHMSGGLCRIEETPDRRVYVEKHDLQHAHVNGTSAAMQRKETELVEFHTALVAMQCFRQIGPLDEGLLGRAEHGDFCIAVRAAGQRVFLEPASTVTYLQAQKLDWIDRDYFLLRRGDEWNRASMERLISKHGLRGPGSDMKSSFEWSRQFMLGVARPSPRWLERLIGRQWSHRIGNRLLSLEICCRALRWKLQTSPARPTPSCRIVHDPWAATS